MTCIGFVALFGLALAAGCGDDGTEDDGGNGGSGGSGASTSSTGGSGGAGGDASTSSSTTSASGGGNPGNCFDYSTFTPQADVSFTDDIMPIFADSCNGNNCHGDANNPDAGLYLGEQNGNDATIVQAVYDNLVNVGSQLSTNLQRVVPGDAENSWLMVKLDGEMDCPQVTCVSNGCGQRMPRGMNAQPLPEAELTLVRSWILNGAPAP